MKTKAEKHKDRGRLSGATSSAKETGGGGREAGDFLGERKAQSARKYKLLTIISMGQSWKLVLHLLQSVYHGPHWSGCWMAKSHEVRKARWIERRETWQCVESRDALTSRFKGPTQWFSSLGVLALTLEGSKQKKSRMGFTHPWRVHWQDTAVCLQPKNCPPTNSALPVSVPQAPITISFIFNMLKHVFLSDPQMHHKQIIEWCCCLLVMLDKFC